MKLFAKPEFHPMTVISQMRTFRRISTPSSGSSVGKKLLPTAVSAAKTGTSLRGVSRQFREPGLQGRTDKCASRPLVVAHSSSNSNAENPDESAAIVISSVQDFLKRHATDEILMQATASRLTELKGTLQYHLGSLESLQSQFPPAAVTISPAQNTLFTRLLSVKYNVKMAIVTIDAYLDPGFATRFSTYHASDSPDSVTSSELERDVSNRFYYPLRPRPFYLGVGENREVNSQYYLDQLGFTFANEYEGMTVLPMVLLASITSMAEYLNVFLDIQGDLISKSTTMETLKAEMKRSVLLSNVENAKGQPQQQTSRASDILMKEGGLALPQRTRVIAFMSKVPLASQVADAEYCLKIYDRQRQLVQDIIQEAEAKTQTNFVYRALGWTAQKSLQFGGEKARTLIERSVKGLTSLLLMGQVLQNETMFNATMSPGVTSNSAPAASSSATELPPPIDKSKLPPAERAGLIFSEMLVYLAQYTTDGNFNRQIIEQLSTQDLLKIERDVTPMVADFKAAVGELPFWNGERFWLSFSSDVVLKRVLEDVDVELKARAEGRKPEPPPMERPAFPTTMPAGGPRIGVEVGPGGSDSGTLTPGAIDNLIQQGAAGLDPKLRARLEELDELYEIPTQKESDTTVAASAALTALLFGCTGGLLSGLWGVDPFAMFTPPRGAHNDFESFLQVVEWSAPFALISHAFAMRRMEEWRADVQQLVAADAERAATPDAASTSAPLPESIARGSRYASPARNTPLFEMDDVPQLMSEYVGSDPSNGAPFSPENVQRLLKADQEPPKPRDGRQSVADEFVPISPVPPSVTSDLINVSAGEMDSFQQGFDNFRAEELPARIGAAGALTFYLATTYAETLLFRGTVLGTLLVAIRYGPLALTPEFITSDANIQEEVLNKVLGSLVPMSSPSNPVPVVLLFPFIALAGALVEALTWQYLNRWSGTKDYDAATAADRFEQIVLLNDKEGDGLGEYFDNKILKDQRFWPVFIDLGVIGDVVKGEPGAPSPTWVEANAKLSTYLDRQTLITIAKQLMFDISNAQRRSSNDLLQVITASTFLGLETLSTGSLWPALLTQLVGHVIGIRYSMYEVAAFRERLGREAMEVQQRADELINEMGGDLESRPPVERTDSKSF